MLLPTCCLWLLIACGPKAQTFNEKNNINDKLFTKVLSSDKSIPNPQKIVVYKTAFVERLTEQGGIVDYNVQNEKSNLPYVSYIQGYGYQQHLFLANIQSPSDNIWVYFSVKYKLGTDRPSAIECKGFGPGYLSDPVSSASQIRFIRELKIVKQDSNFVAIDKTNAAITFIGTELPSYGVKIDSFDVVKIVEEDANKIGGTKSVVFDIPVIFGDPIALRFRYYTTINLKNN